VEGIYSIINSDTTISSSLKSSYTIGNGETIQFWKDKWMAAGPLNICFPSLYAISAQPSICLAAMRENTLETMKWNFEWTRPLRPFEEIQLIQLCALLSLVNMNTSKED
jgi:hypothetical protein